MKRCISLCAGLFQQKKIRQLFLLLFLVQTKEAVNAQIITWSNTGAATDWYTASNWSPSTAAGAWLPTNVAVFNNAGTATTAGINMGTSALSVGCIDVTVARTRPLTIGNNSAASGTLQLNGSTVSGFSNVILHSAGPGGSPVPVLTLQNNTGGATGLMDIVLGNPVNNLVLVDGPAGQINISSSITGAGKNLTIGGVPITGGVLNLTGANTYTGLTTVNKKNAKLWLNRPGGGTLPAGNDVIINDGSMEVKSNQTLHDISISDIGSLVVADGVTLTITGTFTKSTYAGVGLGAGGTGRIVYTSGASLVYTGLSSTVGNEFPAVNGPTNVVFRSTLANMPFSRTIPGILTVDRSKLLLGSNDFTAAGVTGINASTQIGTVVTNGTGKLSITNIGAAPVVFPVGATINSYNAVTISNGQGLTYGVRVENAVTPPVLTPNNAVNRTWHITPVGPLSASPVNVSFYYFYGDANPGFVYSAPVQLGRYSSVWSVVPPDLPQIVPLATSINVMVPGADNPFVIGNVGSIH